MADADPLALRDIALEIAGEITDYLRDEVDRGHGADTKSSGTDYVTAIDRESERRIVERIGRLRPDDGFMGEEGTDAPGTSGVRWVIDPIDGTTNFVHAHPGFSVSIAAEVDGVVVAGAVGDPMHDQLFEAALAACPSPYIPCRRKAAARRRAVWPWSWRSGSRWAPVSVCLAYIQPVC